MTEPRRMSTRYRGEPPPKRRALTPSPPPTPAKSSASKAKAAPAPVPAPAPESEPEEESDEELPTKLQDGKPIPILHSPQDIDELPNATWQSIAESGVLAAAIERSRQKWTADGVFTRYWTKPSKKKPGTENQPAKESMSRLGTCTMYIEPHAFDITLYTVKDLSMNYQYPGFPPPPAKPTYSHYNPYPQHPTFTTSYEAPPYRIPQPQPPAPVPPTYQPAPTPTPAPQGAGVAETQRPDTHSQTVSAEPQSSARHTETQPAQSKAKETVSTDPVIQMLATRAASDPRLKGLMKIVAAGNASPEQLKEFQGHIDELNNLLKSPRSTNPPPPPSSAPPRGGTELQFSARPEQNPPYQYQYNAPPKPASTGPASNFPTIKMENPAGTYHHSPSGILPPTPAPAPPIRVKPHANKSDIVSIVFDFGGTGDRYSFPRLSILDYLPGGLQVLVSFLVIRKGSTSSSRRYKKSKEYYQPVTMRLASHHPRTLESLARVVAPPDEVRKHMDSVFDKSSPAARVYLPLRLPRDAEADQGAEKSEKVTVPIPLRAEKGPVKQVYDPPGVMMPLAA